MKCRSRFSGENRKLSSVFSSAELAKRVEKVKIASYDRNILANRRARLV